ncbi:MAG: hypothetical protein IJC74_00335 [Clostridia bacterium]|nr:hypothetical protein [Clostridia bacterium]
MKKKILIVVLVVIVAILTVVGILAWKNKSTIEAVIMSQNMTQDEIKEEIVISEKKVDEILEKYLHVLPRELTEEERRKVDSGEVSLYEVVGEIYKETEGNGSSETAEKENVTKDAKNNEVNSNLNKDTKDTSNTSDNKKNTAKADNKKSDNNQTKNNSQKNETQASNQTAGNNSAAVDSVVSQYIGRLYALEGQVASQASGLISAAKSEYIAAAKSTPKEQRAALKASIISKYMGQALSIESSVDSQVSAIIGELRSYLAANGRSTSIADEMYSTYVSKKSAMKAMYMSGS